MQSELFWAETPDGWRLEIKRHLDPDTYIEGRRPVLFIPGYGMNSFILGYHPGGHSMVSYLVSRGLEVWTANLRGQGDTKPPARQTRPIGFRDLALVDVPSARDFVLARTQTGADKVDVVGCSLGASILYALLAHHPIDHGFGAMIAIGGPLRWVKVHPLIQLAFKSPELAGAIPFAGTRRLARAVLPIVRGYPSLLSLYMNAARIDLSQAAEIVKTVDDPIPNLNRQIAHWVRERDLIVDRRNVTRSMAEVQNLPLLCVLANRDGVVPPEAALSILDHIGSRDTEVLVAGDHEHWYAHADLFIAQDAEQRVFGPMADWLERRRDA
jgi:pimeloyl-ACP methyl ester carboxylesterase